MPPVIASALEQAEFDRRGFRLGKRARQFRQFSNRHCDSLGGRAVDAVCSGLPDAHVDEGVALVFREVDADVLGAISRVNIVSVDDAAAILKVIRANLKQFGELADWEKDALNNASKYLIQTAKVA